jgi:RsiW-degrading membrane proteinase PrsW (M82 family)
MPMAGPDQWYYLDGAHTKGPVPAAEIVQLIQRGSLNPATQVAQAGWQTWSPAAIALAPLLAAPPHLSAQAGPAPVPASPAYAIRIHCVSGPDVGKAYMISSAEVSFGKVSGLGLNDPLVAQNHVVLSWNNQVLSFRAFPNNTLRVAGAEVTQGTLSNGQQFQLGASVWQVGTAPVELTHLLSSLGSRLNKLASTEKLEGFSLVTMFSEVFKGRKPGEFDEYFIVGTAKTTPPLDQIETGWPKPWFFMRVLLFMAAVYFCFYKMFDIFENPRLIPGLIVMGALVVPLATVFLFWEMNTPRNVSFHTVLALVCMGGVISLLVSLIGFEIAHLNWLGAAQAGIVEETGKLLAVVLVVRGARYRWILNGMVFGAAIGGGFAAFETAGYSFSDGFFDQFLGYTLNHLGGALGSADDLKKLIFQSQIIGYDGMLDQIHSRSYLAPFGHMLWTSISAGALWRVKGDRAFRLSMLFDKRFLKTFLIPVGLHMLWNSPFLNSSETLSISKHLFLGSIGWYVAFTMIQQGLKQVREAQLAETKQEIRKTQEILTITGRFQRAG